MARLLDNDRIDRNEVSFQKKNFPPGIPGGKFKRSIINLSDQLNNL